VGRYKAQVAADFINRRFAEAGVRVTPHVGKLQDERRFPREWFRGFRLVLGGLDNLEARRYVNSLLCSLVETEGDAPGGAVRDFDAVIPFIDGGTEGFLGSVRVILPKVTSCFECAMHTFPPPTAVAICTIASVPRKPEHCVLWALMIEWPKVMGEGRAPDFDSPADVRWLTESAEARAKAFGIEGVTYSFTLGVAKSIIPAIASTNAMIAAQTVRTSARARTHRGERATAESKGSEGCLRERTRLHALAGLHTPSLTPLPRRCLPPSPPHRPSARSPDDFPRAQVLEALKLATFCAPSIDGVVGYGGSTEGCSCSMEALERRADCVACMAPSLSLTGLDRARATLGDVLRSERLNLKAPTASVGVREAADGSVVPVAPRAVRAPNKAVGGFIYVPPAGAPPAAAEGADEARNHANNAADHEATRGNLERTLAELGFEDGDDVLVSDKGGALASAVEVTLRFA